ncbi:Mitochondrial/chloroplast ribosomal protein L6 [Phaffia rhodozyma]|uniref:Mitochondrial/chloroplast ribosomal protein L6 n=1 Tax=Phaffia rhodozyma TaxID=264483 RepID=A0A0F7SFN6_PHARH|nr:Mitochondrial/chloroplast ribosomal protein L6 [Phaffia rhodozyma]
MSAAFRTSSRLLSMATRSFACPPKSSSFHSFSWPASTIPSSSRLFSSSSVRPAYIGGSPITYASNASFSTEGDNLVVTGPLGSEKVFIHPFVRLFHQAPDGSESEGRLEVAVDNQNLEHQREMWGTTRTLISNALQGVTEGYRMPIKMVGVGYRAALEEAPVPPGMKGEEWQNRLRLNLKLGFSHPVLMVVPIGITVEVPQPTKLFIMGTNKADVAQFAAKIREWRKPEPYRGKGIFVGGETIKRKEGKKK